jgi:hypothetical protein
MEEEIMPVVNGKEYPYTPEGIAAAKRAGSVGSGEDNRFKNLMKSVAKKKVNKKAGKPADELNSDPKRMSNPFIDINNPKKNIDKYGK